MNVLRLRLVVGNVIRSLGSCCGYTLTRGQNEMIQAVGGKYIQKEEGKEKERYRNRNQRTNGPVNAHRISGHIISTKHTKPG